MCTDYFYHRTAGSHKLIYTIQYFIRDYAIQLKYKISTVLQGYETLKFTLEGGGGDNNMKLYGSRNKIVLFSGNSGGKIDVLVTVRTDLGNASAISSEFLLLLGITVVFSIIVLFTHHSDHLRLQS